LACIEPAPYPGPPPIIAAFALKRNQPWVSQLPGALGMARKEQQS